MAILNRLIGFSPCQVNTQTYAYLIDESVQILQLISFYNIKICFIHLNNNK